tara:strand:- start:1140 stop:1319 length:180 start_codon:yes stop_codon:yes gene_type:complete
MSWKDEIKKDEDEDEQYKIIAPLLEKVEEYILEHWYDEVPAIKKAFDELKSGLMAAIGK